MDRKRKGTLNRALVGVILLAAMLTAGLACSAALERHHRTMAKELEDAGWAALSEDWETAKTLTEGVRQQWHRRKSLIAMVADHRPMEEIGVLLERLSVHLICREAGEFASTCAELSARLSTMAESHRLSLQNLL